MNAGEDDPYQVLGVSKDASTSAIKSAYRKLALKHHPDKQKGNENDKSRAGAIFTKIGNAYEILSDEESRRKYDSQKTFEENPRPSSGRYRENFHSEFFSSDPFLSRHQKSRGDFTDPFDLFQQVFADEFKVHRGSGIQNQRGNMSPFNDPFFSDSFSGMGGGFGNSSSGMMGQMMSGMMGGMDQSTGHSSSSFSSFSSSGGTGTSQSVKTTTRIVNGKRETVTERTTVGPDGTVNRTFETSGSGEDARYLEDGSRSRRRSRDSSSFRR